MFGSRVAKESIEYASQRSCVGKSPGESEVILPLLPAVARLLASSSAQRTETDDQFIY